MFSVIGSASGRGRVIGNLGRPIDELAEEYERECQERQRKEQRSPPTVSTGITDEVITGDLVGEDSSSSDEEDIEVDLTSEKESEILALTEEQKRKGKMRG